MILLLALPAQISIDHLADWRRPICIPTLALLPSTSALSTPSPPLSELITRGKIAYQETSPTAHSAHRASDPQPASRTAWISPRDLGPRILLVFRAPYFSPRKSCVAWWVVGWVGWPRGGVGLWRRGEARGGDARGAVAGLGWCVGVVVPHLCVVPRLLLRFTCFSLQRWMERVVGD